MNTQRVLAVVLIIALVLIATFASVTAWYLFLERSAPQTLGKVQDQRGCQSMKVQVVPIGNQFSLTILAANSNRAYARIEQPSFATSSDFLAMATGTAATIGLNATQILGGHGTTTTRFIEFGLNTQHPYTGAVTGVTNLGSSTVNVTECSY